MNHDRINQNSKRFCSYNGCFSDRLTTNGGAITFFSFPKDTERCSKWITNSGREEFRYLTPRELSGKKICELHFAPCMFSNKFKTNLKKYAFPMNWKNAIPELIQIDDDDDDDNDNDNDDDDNDVGDSIETIIVNGTDVEVSDDEVENEQNTLSSTVLDSASTNNQASRNSSNEVTRTCAQEAHPVAVLSNVNNTQSQVEIQSLPAVTSSTTTRVEENSKPTTEKSSSKSNPGPADKTKFHNLPSQTPQGEFFYQQCPSVEETNHSYPEPPDGEMPLFVQQNSVVSMADEAANSNSSEPPSKRRKLDKEAELSAQMKDAMRYLKDITELLTTSEDEFELFGKSVALQLKKMSLCTALAVQAKIQKVLSQYRICDIKRKAQCELEDSKGVEVNGIHSDKSEDEQEDDSVEKHNSPQLSLDCTSETSDNEGDLKKK